MWLSHHQEYMRLDSWCSKAAMTPANKKIATGLDVGKAGFLYQK